MCSAVSYAVNCVVQIKKKKKKWNIEWKANSYHKSVVQYSSITSIFMKISEREGTSRAGSHTHIVHGPPL